MRQERTAGCDASQMWDDHHGPLVHDDRKTQVQYDIVDEYNPKDDHFKIVKP